MDSDRNRDVKKKLLTSEELKKFLPEFFAQDGGAPFPLTVTGGSMAPFLADGRDTVLLTPFDGKVSRGDVLLFDCGGRLLLHRVCAVKNGELWFMGDAHTYAEGPIKTSAVLARCDSVIRDGKPMRKSDAMWRFYEHIWAQKPALRKHLLNAAGLLGKKATDKNNT